MPITNRRLSGLWSVATILVLIIAALMGGWWLGRRDLFRSNRPDPRQVELANEATQLRQRLDRGEATDADRQRLLELLVGLDRKAEAITLLEPMADQEPDRWSLRLLLAELRRDSRDLSGAERELRLILNRKPDQAEALHLFTLVLLEQGRGAEAEARVKAAYATATKPTTKPEALPIGLLLAEVQQRRQQPALAEATYLRLAGEFPADQRPLLGLAMLRHERGNAQGAQEALAQARLRSKDPGRPDPMLDRLAASWGLETLRVPSSTGSGRDRTTPAPRGTTEPRTP
jgi:tetratricopeptide (TPR) repeat protein